jgi:Na+/H+ antiporter NhaD/arsenite permease-like protein
MPETRDPAEKRTKSQRRFKTDELGIEEPRPRWRQLAKGLLVTLAVIASFFAGVPIAEAALVGGSLLLLSRAVTPRKNYAGIDGGLLLMFAGLFIVVAGAEKMLLTPQLVAAVQQLIRF